jgi:putative ABC transport system permease protein
LISNKRFLRIICHSDSAFNGLPNVYTSAPKGAGISSQPFLSLFSYYDDKQAKHLLKGMYKSVNVITRGVRNAFRNGIRTFSIISILSLSIALALAMVMARGAVQKKIDSVKSSIGNSVTIAPAGVQGFEGGGEPLKAADISALGSLSHVSSVIETLQDRLQSDGTNLESSIDAGSLGRRFRMRELGQGQSSSASTLPAQTNFKPPITVSSSSDLSTSEAALNGAVKLASGKTFAANSTENVALIGKALAEKNSLSVGSTFTAYNTTITLVGIYDTGNQFTNNGVIMPLATLQKLSGQDDQISTATVKVDTLGNVDSVVSAIKNKLGSKADVTSQQSEAQTALAPLENIKSISLFSLIGAIIAGAVIILLTMVMIVRERRREIGVLKAIGGSNLTVMLQFMSEAVTFTLIAAAVGILLGIVGGNPITKALVNNSTGSSNSMQIEGPGSSNATGSGNRSMRRAFGGPRALTSNLGLSGQNLKNVKAVVGWSVLAYGLVAALVIALAGSAMAALLIAKIRPAEVMRAE